MSRKMSLPRAGCQTNVERVVLVACGSYNPITNMHLRMFEVAKDHLQATGRYKVVGGILSPVHDDYGKAELVASTHRVEMCRLAVQSSDWVRVSNWECTQSTWTCTRDVLVHFEALLNSENNAAPIESITDIRSSWLLTDNASAAAINGTEAPDAPPLSVAKLRSSDCPDREQGNVRVMLLCGGDLLESFAKPGLWETEHIDELTGRFGLAVIRRAGNDADRFVYENDTVYANRASVHLITEWLYNEISSTRVRKALKRSESVKYVMQDAVIDYIEQNGLYKE